jgi:DNA-binding transcriptional LysR family regulator
MECRTLRVGINGQFEAVLLPAMVRAFQQQVPGVRVIMRAISFPMRTLVTDTKLIAANTCGTA